MKPYVSWVPTQENLRHSMAQQFSPSRHHVLELNATEVGRWLHDSQRFLLLDGRNLFLYFHLDTRSFSIARWLNEDHGLFQDILSLGSRVTNFASGDMKILYARLRPPDAGLFEKYLEDLRVDERNHLEKLQTRQNKQTHKPKVRVTV